MFPLKKGKKPKGPRTMSTAKDKALIESRIKEVIDLMKRHHFSHGEFFVVVMGKVSDEGTSRMLLSNLPTRLIPAACELPNQPGDISSVRAFNGSTGQRMTPEEERALILQDEALCDQIEKGTTQVDPPEATLGVPLSPAQELADKYEALLKAGYLDGPIDKSKLN
jgi:hypothetical protein